MTQRSLSGGVKVRDCKSLSNQHPIAISYIPDQLVIPLLQSAGHAASLKVKVGDYVYKGQPLTSMPKAISAVTHASSSGTIIAIEKRLVAHTSGLKNTCIVIQTDQKEDWGTYQLPSLCAIDCLDLTSTQRNPQYPTISPSTLLQRLTNSGIVGLGGAAFPTAIKLAITTPTNNPLLQTLIINAAECEPYITCDDCLIQEQANAIIDGIHLVTRSLSITQCIIGIEDNKPKAIETLQTAIDNINTDQKTRITLGIVPAIYPSGDAKQLVYLLTGIPIDKRTRSSDYKIVVLNVATLHSIYEALVLGYPLLSRIVTVTGRGVNQPYNTRALLGTSFSQLIAQAKGYNNKAEHLIMGGPMMGIHLRNDRVPVTKATNCILVMPSRDLPYSLQPPMPCIRCAKCSDACPVDLLPQQLYWYAKAKKFDQVEAHHIDDCMECGCCNYVCPSNIPLVDYFRFAKSEIHDATLKLQKAELARRRHEYRDLRIQRIKQEREAKRAKHKARLAAKKAQQSTETNDRTHSSTTTKHDVIQAALERAKAKKAQLKQANTTNLSHAQQAQVDRIDKERKNR